MTYFGKRARQILLSTATVIGLALAVAGQSGTVATAAPRLAASVVPAGAITTQSVGMQMFMWPWVSLQTECTYVLGPEHIDWIMVSPPQEDITGPQWWTHYQPVSYSLNSQLGTERQFTDMVSACNDAGVKVIVDAVINHMSASNSGVGFDNTAYTKYSYPGLYDSADFHAGLATIDPNNYCGTRISNFSDPFQVTHCELLGLSDLATEKPSVRQTIADYLNHLIDLGVAGFRIDAAKHIGLDDLTAIHGLLNPVNGQPPYFVQESIGTARYNSAWTGNGDVFAWDYQALFANMFNGQANYLISSPVVNNILGNPDNTVIMVSNHDTERSDSSHPTITYEDYKKYQAASEFLLADPRGKPMLYTGYSYLTKDSGPTQDSSGFYLPATCPAGSKAAVQQKSYPVGTYVCMERWTGIKGMIQWRHEVASAPQTNAAVSGKLASFTRGTGFFAINASQTFIKGSLTKTVKTGLPKGTYCDVISGGATAKRGGKCIGTTVVVDSKGKAKITLASMTALALDKSNKLK